MITVFFYYTEFKNPHIFERNNGFWAVVAISQNFLRNENYSLMGPLVKMGYKGNKGYKGHMPTYNAHHEGFSNFGFLGQVFAIVF